MVHEPDERLEILQHQVRPLVGGEPPREPDRQGVEAERAAKLGDDGGRFAPALRLLDGAAACEVDQPGLQRLVRLPQLAVVDVLDGAPEIRLRAARRPVRAEVPLVDLAHLRRQPGVDVHTVGDVADRHLVFAEAGVQRHPHPA